MGCGGRRNTAVREREGGVSVPVLQGALMQGKQPQEGSGDPWVTRGAA